MFKKNVIKVLSICFVVVIALSFSNDTVNADVPENMKLNEARDSTSFAAGKNGYIYAKVE